MAGHSKFKNIMYRKGAQDKKRASLFSKLSKEITVAAKLGAPDPDQNARLRSAIQLAKASSFPKENIDRAIKKSLDKDTVNYDQMRYEGFGPNGTSIIVEALTDNRNRTASNVRSAFQKFGGSMGETGSVSHAFNHYGFVRYNKDVTSEEDFFNFSIEGGAEDCFIEEDTYEAVSTPETLSNLYNYLDKNSVNLYHQVSNGNLLRMCLLRAINLNPLLTCSMNLIMMRMFNKSFQILRHQTKN